MENDIFHTIIEILTLVLGVCVPVFVVLIKNILKKADDSLKERDKKIDKLFEICDNFRSCLTDKAREISSIQTDINWLKEAMQKINGRSNS